jgi:putative glycosyltransferase
MPLFAVFAAGIVVSAFSVVFILYLLVQRLVWGVGIAGWTSVMAGVILLGGLTLFFNGIIAIYVGTIFLEVKRRPTVIREIVRSETSAEKIEDDAVVSSKRAAVYIGQ